MNRKILTIFLAMILVGLGSYFIVSRHRSAGVSESVGSALEGIWRTDELLRVGSDGKPQITSLAENKVKTYIEFKGDQVCSRGEFDESDKPKPCPTYLKFSLKDNAIAVSQTTGAIINGVWSIKDRKLSLIMDNTGSPLADATWVFIKYR